MEQTPNQGSGQPNSTGSGFLGQIENEVAKVYAKITFHLPANVREFIVHYGPWIALVLMIIAIPATLLALGLSAIVSPFVSMYGGAHVGGIYFVSGLISLGALILEAMALPGLFKRQIGGWRLVFYSVLLGAVANLLAMNWGGLIIGTAIGLYVLFEIKGYYK